MPLYDYECSTDGIFEGYASMAECSKPAICPKCGAEAKRVFSTQTAIAVFKPYVDDTSFPETVTITSKRQLREICKRHELIPKALAGTFKSCSR